MSALGFFFYRGICEGSSIQHISAHCEISKYRLYILCIQCILLSCHGPPSLCFPWHTFGLFSRWVRPLTLSMWNVRRWQQTLGGTQPADSQQGGKRFVQGADILGRRMWNIGWHLCSGSVCACLCVCLLGVCVHVTVVLDASLRKKEREEGEDNG